MDGAVSGGALLLLFCGAVSTALGSKLQGLIL